MKINKELFDKLAKEFEEKNIEREAPCGTCARKMCGGQPIGPCSEWLPKFKKRKK